MKIIFKLLFIVVSFMSFIHFVGSLLYNTNTFYFIINLFKLVKWSYWSTLLFQGDDVDKLHRIFITSHVEALASMEHTSSTSAAYTGIYSSPEVGELWIGVSCTNGAKCKRCSIYSQVVGSFVDHPTLCEWC